MQKQWTVPLAATTTDICNLTNESRDWYINNTKATSHTLPTPDIGHNVSGHVTTYHKLKQHTPQQHIAPFIVERVREELSLVTTPPHSLPLSQVCILFSTEVFEQYKTDVTSFLNTHTSTRHHTPMLSNK